jgi:foldase protein PrsA
MDVAWTHVITPSVSAVANVNGVDVSASAFLAELRRQLYYVTAQYQVDWNDSVAQQQIPAFQDQVVEQIVQIELAKQIAKREGITITAAEVVSETAATKVQVVGSGQYGTLDEFLTTMGMTEQTFSEQIAVNLLFDKLQAAHGGPDPTEQVHVAHILVETAEVGNEVLAKLKAGEGFAVLAKQYSTDDSTKETGGELPWFPKGAMDPAFDAAAFALKTGETSALVESSYGFHVIRLLGKETRPIGAEFLDNYRQQNFETWFTEQMAKANTKVLVTFAQPAS